MANSPLDPEAPSDEDEIVLSKEDELTNYMSSLGFRAKEPRSKDTLEYFRTYTTAVGNNARVVAVIEKDSVGLEPSHSAYFTATVQIYVPGISAEARSKAPAFCREDILRILAFFDDKSDRNEAELIECGLCGMTSAEFQLFERQKVCLDCARRKGIQ